MDYSQFILMDLFTSPDFILYLCSVSDALNQGWDAVNGKVTWTAKGGKKIAKVVVESVNANVASRVLVTSSDTGAATTLDGALTTCTFSGNGVDSFVISLSANISPIIKKITVTYQ